MARYVVNFLIICLLSFIGLSACGVRPELNQLVVPEKDDQDISLEEPEPAATVDGRVDGQEPVPVEKEDRGFLLDFLL